MAGKQATNKADGGAGDEEVVVLTPVGDGADAQAQASEDRGGEGDDRGKDKGGEDPDGGEERRLGASDEDVRDDDERGGGERDAEGRAQRPRLSRRERNDLRRRSKERDRTEIRFLRTRNEQLERTAIDQARRLDKIEAGQVDGKIGQIKAAIQRADATVIKATAAGEEAAALEAASVKNNLTEQLRREEARKAAPPERGPEAGARDELPPAVVRNVQGWMARNPWFDPDLNDRDSRFARALDEEILAEGFDPTDPEYYRELDKRVQEEFPHLRPGGERRRARERDDDRDEGRDRDDRREDRDQDRGGDREERRGGRRPSGPKFRVGGVERALKPNEVFVTEERRKALEEMGVWDDPKLRNRYLNSYKRYDEDKASSRDR